MGGASWVRVPAREERRGGSEQGWCGARWNLLGPVVKGLSQPVSNSNNQAHANSGSVSHRSL